MQLIYSSSISVGLNNLAGLISEDSFKNFSLAACLFLITFLSWQYVRGSKQQ